MKLGVGLSLAFWLGAFCPVGYGSDDDCSSGINAFSTHMHTFVRAETLCTVCHSGAVQSAPAWAADDIAEAYDRMKGFVNFAEPERSKLIDRLNNGHCGPGCQNNTALQQAFAARIQAWWDNGEAQCHQGHPAVTVPIRRESAAGFIPIEWQIRPLANMHEGIKIRAEIRALVDQTTQLFAGYVLRSVKVQIMRPASSIALRHLRFAVNGQFDDLANQFESVNLTVTNAQELTLPAKTILLKGYTLGTDVIGAEFAKVELAN